MKKRIAGLLCCCMVALLPALRAGAEGGWQKPADVQAAVLIESTSGTVLCGENENAACSVAGLSKFPALLTLAQAFDAGTIRDEAPMRVSGRAAAIGGPTAFLDSGEELAAAELMKAAVMISAGDAIMALGEGAYGSESVFVENINATLRLAGVDSTVTDALGTGLTLSAAELARLGAAAAKSPAFTRYSGLYLDRLVHADGRETELVNANRLVRSYAGCIGLLTGSSASDGYCGIFAAAKSGTECIAVVIGARDTAARFSAAAGLLDYGFATYRTETLAAAGETILPGVPVEDGTLHQVDLVVHEPVVLLLMRTAERPSAVKDVPERLIAPLSADDPVGEVRFVDGNGEVLARSKLYPAESVPAFRLMDILHAIARDFLGK